MLDSAAAEKPAVLVYAEPLLARSMTFISTQAEALTSFSPHYISPHYLREGLPLPWERVVVMRRGQGRFSRLTELPFKVAAPTGPTARALRFCGAPCSAFGSYPGHSARRNLPGV